MQTVNGIKEGTYYFQKYDKGGGGACSIQFSPPNSVEMGKLLPEWQVFDCSSHQQWRRSAEFKVEEHLPQAAKEHEKNDHDEDADCGHWRVPAGKIHNVINLYTYLYLTSH